MADGDIVPTVNDFDPTLYAQVLKRLAEARHRLASMPLSPEVRTAVEQRLTRLAHYAQTDLTITSRQVEAVHADIDAGHAPLYD
jgi:DNA-binding TFAR19-related protein (PDSD5 family)